MGTDTSMNTAPNTTMREKTDMGESVARCGTVDQRAAVALTEIVGNPSFTRPALGDDGLVGISGWNVTPTGDWDVDHAMGEAFAEEAAAYASAKGCPAFLTFVLTSILHRVHSGSGYGAIEAGFCSRIAAFVYDALRPSNGDALAEILNSHVKGLKP